MPGLLPGNQFVSRDSTWIWGNATGFTSTFTPLGGTRRQVGDLLAMPVLDNRQKYLGVDAQGRVEFWREPPNPMNWWSSSADASNTPKGQIAVRSAAFGAGARADASYTAQGFARGTLTAPRAWYRDVYEPRFGGRIPRRGAFWVAGWVDGDYGIVGRSRVLDLVTGEVTTLFDDGFFDNGDGTTFDHTGTGWDPGTLVHTDDVGEPDQVLAGWLLTQHDLALQQLPYEYDFWVDLEEVGGDADIIEFAYRYRLDVCFSSTSCSNVPAPEALPLLATCGVFFMAIFLRRRHARPDLG